MSDTYCIYRIVNFQNGKCYVGLTVDPKARKRAHFGALRRQTHYNAHLQNSYNHYGKSAFWFEIIEENISGDDIKDRECYWVTHFNSEKNGYNRTPGGDARGGDRVNPCIWNGIKYRSISEAARVYGITAKAMRMRLKKGFACDADVKAWEKRCVWNGVEYPSVKAAAKANDVTEAGMEQRIRKGYATDADVFVNGICCTWNGIEYSNIAEAAKANGLTPSSMQYRIRRGYTCDSDLNGTHK